MEVAVPGSNWAIPSAPVGDTARWQFFDYAEQRMITAIRRLKPGRGAHASRHDHFPGTPEAGIVIEAKVAGQNIVETPQQQMAPVIDIMEALKQSLLISKKPATSATEIAPAEEPVAKKRGGKRASG